MKDWMTRTPSTGPKRTDSKRTCDTAISKGTRERASGKGTADGADSEDISNAVAGECTVIDQMTRALAAEAEE